jgi:hypothetical protein
MKKIQPDLKLQCANFKEIRLQVAIALADVLASFILQRENRSKVNWRREWDLNPR